MARCQARRVQIGKRKGGNANVCFHAMADISDVPHKRAREVFMGLTWGSLILFVVVAIGLPTAVISLNRWKRYAGWWLLAAFVALIIVSNLAEMATRGSFTLFSRPLPPHS